MIPFKGCLHKHSYIVLRTSVEYILYNSTFIFFIATRLNPHVNNCAAKRSHVRLHKKIFHWGLFNKLTNINHVCGECTSAWKITSGATSWLYGDELNSAFKIKVKMFLLFICFLFPPSRADAIIKNLSTTTYGYFICVYYLFASLSAVPVLLPRLLEYWLHGLTPWMLQVKNLIKFTSM